MNRVGARVYRLLRWLSDNMLRLFLGLGALIAIFVFLGTWLKPLIFIALFIVLGAVSLIYNRWIKTSLGIEFISLGTVLCSRVYGPGAGLVVGLISLSAAEIIGTGFNPRTAISLGAVMVMALITPLFNGMAVSAAGLILVLIYDAIIIPLYLVAGSSPVRSGLFVVTHILWSIWVFFAIAPAVEHLMLATALL